MLVSGSPRPATMNERTPQQVLDDLGLSIAEIARQLDITRQAATVQVRRGYFTPYVARRWREVLDIVGVPLLVVKPDPGRPAGKASGGYPDPGTAECDPHRWLLEAVHEYGASAVSRAVGIHAHAIRAAARDWGAAPASVRGYFSPAVVIPDAYPPPDGADSDEHAALLRAVRERGATAVAASLGMPMLEVRRAARSWPRAPVALREQVTQRMNATR